MKYSRFVIFTQCERPVKIATGIGQDIGKGYHTTGNSQMKTGIEEIGRTGQNVEIFGRTIPREIASKALATIGASFSLVVVSALLIQILEAHGSDSVEHTHFLDWLFEVVSAYGTVGLSTGVTPELKPASKLVIVATMFAGRVGPLGLALSLFKQETVRRFKYPEENVMIG